ncbi:MAG: polysaccharide deacetylase family protein [Candidatus Eisenbacteria bacterium]|nr:polysaccharide deacetylase family protein [Candidatus Eisenbacteria bacterium]
MLLAIAGCTTQVESPELPELPERLELHCSRSYLVRGDSVQVSVLYGVGRSLAPELRFAWSATFGQVVGQGSSVSYVAPDTAATVIIRVTIHEVGSLHDPVRQLAIPVFRQIIILKADDFVFSPYEPSGFTPGWAMFIDYIRAQGLKASIGIPGQRIMAGHDEFFAALGEMQASGVFEFFNHGWDHVLNQVDERSIPYSEFWHTSYEQQLEHLRATQDLLARRAGIVLRGFGAPGNVFDSSTRRALDQVEEIEYWVFGSPPTRKLVLPYHPIKIEEICAQPDYEVFRSTYDPAVSCIVYQIHPWFWTHEQLSELARCVQDLQGMGVTFMLPGEYCTLNRTPGQTSTASLSLAS